MSKKTMKKPTLKQYLLRQPSQSYTIEKKPETNYFSSYSYMAALSAASSSPSPLSRHSPSSSFNLDAIRATQRETSHTTTSRRHRSRPAAPEHEFIAAPQPPNGPLSASNSDNDNSDSDNDTVFHTPLSTPEATPSPASSSPMFEPLLLPALNILSRPDRLQPFGNPSLSPPSSANSQLSDGDPDEDKISSRSWHSDSTALTTPTTSSQDSGRWGPDDSDNTPRTAASRGAKATSIQLARHSDWTRDPRWLPPADQSGWIPPDTRGRPNTSPSMSPPASDEEHLQIIASSGGMGFNIPPPPPPIREHRRRKSRRYSSSQWSSRSVSEKMSFILEEDESEDGTTTSGSVTPPSPALDPASAARRARTRTMTSRRYTSSVYSTTSKTSSYTATGRTVLIPSPLPGSHGSSEVHGAYGSLVLPRAAFTPSKHPDRVSSQIDITKSGLAQTTMSTIEITRGSAMKSNSSSRHSSRLSILRGSSNTSSSPTPAHLLANSPSPLSFMSHTPPPNKLQSGQVLVQVFMVALDGLDALLVKEKTNKSGGFGFVPGRSFAGRAIECGFEVRNVHKGDWVFGLLDLTKCGALAEFIIVDRRRIHRAPNISKTNLSLEQIAGLPLCGVPAHRAIRTLRAPGKECRALVLNAHDGVGALVTQMLVGQGVKVTAQVPTKKIEQGTEEEEKKEQEDVSFEDRARQLGATDVHTGDPLTIIASLNSSSSQFDYILDTAGGRQIWDASRWILRTGGQFTTLIGDDVSLVPFMTSNLKSNLRSIRGAIKREWSYEWVLPNAELDTEGEDVRDALGAIARMVEGGEVRPVKRWAVPFEKAPDVFVEGRGLLVDGGVVVIKILG